MNIISSAYKRGMIKISEYLPEATKMFTPRLLSVAIEPTNFCNLRCKNCYSQNPKIYPPRKKGFMSWELYKEIIDELCVFDYHIALGLNFGGESLLHSNFGDMLKYASDKQRFSIGFTTNGTLLDKKILENKIDNITISLDGLGEKHEAMRTGSNYNLVEKNIRDLLEARGKNPLPRIHVNMMVTSDTSESDINDFKTYWWDIADSVQIFSCLSEDLQTKTPLLTPKNKYCRWPFSYMAILWNGDVTTCCHDINGINMLGNVNMKSIAQIWESNTFASMRYKAVSNQFEPNTLCSKCNAWKFDI